MHPEDTFARVRQTGRLELTEQESRMVFQQYGIPVVDGTIVTTAGEAIDTARGMGYPVVMKISSPDILHKTDAGGVRTGIRDPEGVEREFHAILRNVRGARPEARIDGIMMQPMESRGLEVIIGGVRDEVFGSIVMFGMGGILTEILGDVTFGLAPVTHHEAVEMIEGIRSRALLHGYRGGRGIDISALARILVRISTLMEHPEVAEVDANPVFAKPDGAVCVDARIILARDPPSPGRGPEAEMDHGGKGAGDVETGTGIKAMGAGKEVRETEQGMEARETEQGMEARETEQGMEGGQSGKGAGTRETGKGTEERETGKGEGTREMGKGTEEGGTDILGQRRTDRNGSGTVDPRIRNLFLPGSVLLVGSSSLRRKGRMASPELFADIGYNMEKWYTGTFTVFDTETGDPSDLDTIRADTAILALPSEESVAILPRLNVGSIIQIDGGFTPELRDRYLRHLRRTGIRMLGPTTIMGVISPDIGLNTSFARDLMPRPGHIAILSQSGGVGAILLDWAATYGIGISRFAFMGEKLDVGDEELLSFLDADPQTRVICIYMEGVRDGRGFLDCMKKIRKPVLVLKGGTGEASKKRAASHTASMAGRNEVFDAAFRSAGVIRVGSIEELFGGATAMISQPPMQGNRVVVVSNVGGPAILAADALEGQGLHLAELDPGTRSALSRRFPEIFPSPGSVINPIDTIADARGDRFEGILREVLQDPGVDGIMVITMLTSTFFRPEDAKVIAAVTAGSPKPVIAVPAGGSDFLRVGKELEGTGLPVYDLPEKAARVLRLLYDQHLALQKKGK